MKILFVGWGRCGKDEAAQFAESHLGLRYGGSFSWHAKELVAAELKIHPMTAWETRHKHRGFWKSFLDRLRLKDQCFLAKLALQSGDIVAGLRDKIELDAVLEEKLFHVIVWVDRPGTPEDPTVTFTRDDVLAVGGHYIENDGSLRDYHRKLIHFFQSLEIPLNYSSYALELLDEEN
jgi:hypothetical protein